MKTTSMIPFTLVLAACTQSDLPPGLADVRFDTVVTVGVAEGNERETFGFVQDIEPAGKGGFFLLDGQARSVSWFDGEGRFRGGINARGKGPGELTSPSDLAVLQDGSVLIVDPGNVRISRFQPTSEGLRFADERRHEFGGRVCALGDRVFVHALRRGTLVHELKDGAEPAQSFGTPPALGGLDALGPFRSLAEGMLLSGRLLCLPDRDLLVAASTSSARIQAFEPDGTLTWETTLNDFYPIRYIITKRGGLRHTLDPATGAHILQSFTRWDQNTLLLQYEVRKDGPAPEGREYHAIESRLLDLQTGREIARSRTLPLLAAIAGDYVYERRNLPIPQVTVLRRR